MNIESIQAKLAADEARKHPGIWRDVRGWCWVARAPGRPGWSEGIGVGRMTFQKRERPGFDRWRFAWTRAKHLRRAAEKWQVLQVAVHLSAYDTEVNDTREYLTVLRRSTGAREMRDAYREAAERADWGTRP